MTRPDWRSYFMDMAYLVATRATCPRKQVGAVLVDPDFRVVATGYNGSPAGTPHCTEFGCEIVNIDGRDSCVRTLHSESNCIDYAGKNARGCTLYVTCHPCLECAKRIVNAGIHAVEYDEYYVSQKTDLANEFLCKELCNEYSDRHGYISCVRDYGYVRSTK